MRQLLTALLAGASFFTPAAYATTVLSLNFDQLVQMADGIVAGTVHDVYTEKAENGIIYRYVTLGELDVVSGSYGAAEITLRFEGGALGNEIQEVHGSPDFEVGERVLTFIDGNGQQIVPLVGWEQGLFRIEHDPAGNEVVHDAAGNRVFGVDDGRLLKESRFEFEVELFQTDGPGTGRGENPEGSFGMTETGEVSELTEATTSNTPLGTMVEGEALSLDAFIERIEDVVTSFGAFARAQVEREDLVSVEPGSESLVAGDQDGAPQDTVIEPQEQLEMAPQSGRGRRPGRILPDRADEDLQ